MRKKELEIILSGLNTFQKQDISLEQYQTESSIAADLLWHAFQQGDIEGKTIGDFGCGNGIFGIGALLLGAKKVHFVDVHAPTLALAKENLKSVQEIVKEKFSTSFSRMDIRSFKKKVDLVIQNPPFGVKRTHADKNFLHQSMKYAQKIYTFHKKETGSFVERFVEDNGWEAQLLKVYKFPLRKTETSLAFWKKKVHYVNVGVWVLEPLS